MKENKKRVYWTIADEKNLKYYEMLKKSFEHFNPKEELILIGEDDIKSIADKDFFYRATPAVNKMLFDKGYTEVCKIDSDSIVCDSLDDIWTGGFDVAVVNNGNPRETEKYPVGVWDIPPMVYVNCGLVAMRSKEFNDHWLGLCYSYHFPNYQFREQDLLNILCYYNNVGVNGKYTIKLLDAGNSFWGLSSKGYWSKIEVSKDKLTLHPQQEKDFVYPATSKWIKVLHAAGGNTPDKWNFDVQFKEETALWLKNLVK